MKVFHYLPKNIGSFAIFSILLTACVNHISEENEAIIADGNIPLKFVTDIHELTNTRIVGNSFEEGEGVGLFALAGSTTMQIIFILFVLPEASFCRMSWYIIRMTE